MIRSLVLLAAVAAVVTAEGNLRVNGETGQFVDDAGRERFFRGVNIVFKGEPWHPSTDGFHPQLSLVQQDVDNLKAWGFNAVRLGVMWPGAEPTQGTYNETYFEIIRNMTEMLYAGGIYSIIDFHQDCLAASFCGEGIPEWAVDVKDNALRFPLPFGKPFSADKHPPIPSKADCDKHAWSIYQATSAASSAYQSLYSPGRVRDAFVLFWQRIARDYITSPAVIAYEIINEPWAGDVFVDPSLMVPGVADKNNLQPFYDVVQQGIRAVDDQHLVMFESVTWDDIKIGFSHVPGGDAYGNMSALSYHYYEPPNLGVKQAFNERDKEVKRMKTAGFLTEFDMCNKKEKLVEVLDVCDTHMCSWTGWEYKSFVPITGVCSPFYTQDGAVVNERVRILARTYARAVAGRTTLVKFDEESSAFTLEYTVDGAVKEPTEIYFNSELRYTNGIDVKLSPPTAATFTIAHNSVVITHNAGSAGVALRVDITPK